MKKIIFAIVVCLVLANCEIKPREVSADKVSLDFEEGRIERRYFNGIEYHIYSTVSGYRGGVFVVNHTKELLEVEYLKKQLGKQ